ncbi:conserved membrane hypothetical protein [Frankia canadensis]|uniref:Integral membrane protein n=1 Tax=Frankia canadensis TaxID=1836972 RepID=A0A2I2KZC1_9ACTN|nr:M50 family metallopeptidase [Frankia canadensis]SNQ51011.1 conserved membrane hypothetical protein [Frankia canadensis]SOU58301.1 conserved membrane hypothetical protein [Frankia canadensis]
MGDGVVRVAQTGVYGGRGLVDGTTGGAVAVVVEATAPRTVAVVTGLFALVAVLSSGWAERIDTAVHEGGHALAAYLAGRQVLAVWLDQDGGGRTLSYGRPRGLGLFLTRSAGYTAPPLVGVCSAALLAAGNVTAVLMLAALGLGALLLVTINRAGELLLLLTIASLVLAGRYCPGWVQLWYAYFLTWLLLFSGPRSVLILHRARRLGIGDSDADKIGAMTHLPGFLWVLAFAVFSLWCTEKGAALLLA